jgi:AcrR family transcriptional regulator
LATSPSHPPVDPETEGLRERKKRQTRQAIADAALDLFQRQGYAATTIAQIAAAADVSPRTVFGYFASKEELVFPEEAEWYARLEARINGRPPEETAPEALRGWIEETMPEWDGREDELRARSAVIAGDDGLRARKAHNMERVHELLAGAIARDLGRSPEALEARMAAAATTAILEMLEHKGQETVPDEWRAEAIAALDRAVIFIAAGIRALRDADVAG